MGPPTTVLQEILDVSRSIQAATTHAAVNSHSGNTVITSTTNTITPPSPCIFPPLPDITPKLRAMGLSDHSIQTLVNVYYSSCTKLQNLHRGEMVKMISNSSPHCHGMLQSTIFKWYLRNLNAFESDILRWASSHCEKLRSSRQSSAKGNRSVKTVFNHDYVPVLEKYFEYNAYPTAADRALMARKSLMTERQIEVWFQNHRNRARKEGKPLARLRASDPLPSDVSFDSLGGSMGDLIRPESERLMMEQQENDDDDSDGIEALTMSLNATSSSHAGSVDSEIGTPEPTASPQPQQPTRDSLNPLASPFAYPAPYVPQLHTFLSTASRPAAFTFPQPTWARQASATRSNSNAELSRRDVDAFADLFTRLNQRYTTPAATCAITTILCPGRHPAFIPSIAPRTTRRARKSPSPAPPPYESWTSSPGAGPSKPSTPTSSTSTTAFTFQSPPQYSQSAASISPPVNATPKASTPTPRRRKSPQLPRRVPGSPPVARPYSQAHNQTTSHPTPQRSPRPSHHPYASPSSSHRSSSSSASSSTPTTPNSPMMSLPISYPINTPKNTKPTSPIFTAQNIVDIFGDAAAFTTPSSQGFSGFGTAGFDSPDFGRMLMGNMFDFNFNTSHGPSIVQARS
uniref:Homeodomain 2 mating type protein n=1 Tax=Pleurotus eryngii TaxID=5323 RepID=A0A482JR63_PLEER|nr:homeodomain 2 mating type protein [Pleurotus eryngii]